METRLVDAAVQNSLVAFVILLGIMMLKQIFKANKEEILRNTHAMDRLADKLNQTMVAVTKLELHIENLNKMISRTDKHEKDLHIAFEMIREMKRDTNGSG